MSSVCDSSIRFPPLLFFPCPNFAYIRNTAQRLEAHDFPPLHAQRMEETTRKKTSRVSHAHFPTHASMRHASRSAQPSLFCTVVNRQRIAVG